MMTGRGNSGRGSHLQLTALTLGFVLVVLAIIMLTTPTRETDAPKAGTSPLYEGINLPVADAAQPGEPSAETTLEVPLAWGKDPEDSIKKLRERVKQVAEALPKSTESPGGRLDYDEGSNVAFGAASYPSVIVAIDRDLHFLMLYWILHEGRDGQVVNFRIACHTSAKGGDIGYLTITLFRACCGPSSEEPRVLTVEVFPQREGTRYKLTRRTEFLPKPAILITHEDGSEEIEDVAPRGETIGNFDDLSETMAELRAETRRNAATIFAIMPHDNVTVQQFVDVYNGAVKTGCRRILVGRPPNNPDKEKP